MRRQLGGHREEIQGEGTGDPRGRSGWCRPVTAPSFARPGFASRLCPCLAVWPCAHYSDGPSSAAHVILWDRGHG